MQIAQIYHGAVTNIAESELFHQKLLTLSRRRDTLYTRSKGTNERKEEIKMYNKSEIMKKAWELYRTAKANEKATWFLGEMVVFNKASFSESLKEAWAEVKRTIKVEAEATP